MKSVVVEINNQYALVLKQDGSFVRLRNRNYSVGDEMDLAPGAGHRNLPFILSMAASLVLMLTVSAYAYFTPYSYISMDVNPSIEYTLNRFDRIIQVRTCDVESQELVQSLHVQHYHADTAVEKTLEQLRSLQYLKANQDNMMMIAVASANEEHAAKLMEKVSVTLRQAAERNQIRLQIHTAQDTPARVMEARQMGTTFGKLRLIERLRDSSPDPAVIQDHDWIHSSVQDIVQKTIQSGKHNSGFTDGTSNGNQNYVPDDSNGSVSPPEPNREGDGPGAPVDAGDDKGGKTPSTSSGQS